MPSPCAKANTTPDPSTDHSNAFVLIRRDVALGSISRTPDTLLSAFCGLSDSKRCTPMRRGWSGRNPTCERGGPSPPVQSHVSPSSPTRESQAMRPPPGRTRTRATKSLFVGDHNVSSEVKLNGARTSPPSAVRNAVVSVSFANVVDQLAAVVWLAPAAELT